MPDNNGNISATTASGSSKTVSEGAFDPHRKRTQGHVIHCDSKRAVVAADVDPNVEYMENYWAVGQLISIQVGANRVIGQTASVEFADSEWQDGKRNKIHIHIELVGEIFIQNGEARFTTGISGFPQMGCIAHRIRTADLAAIYENKADSTITIGHLTQDGSIKAKIDFEKLLSRHFAVVGSTGVGKSTAVSLMLRKIVEVRPEIRVLMLDPHNEFSAAFPDDSLVVNAKNLTLPFWLFGLDEIAEVIFRGQSDLDAEKEMLRDFITIAKQQQLQENEEGNTLVRKHTHKARVSADTPIPYRMADLLKLIDDRLGLLDKKAEKPILKSLKDRIETISNDARFQFMFDPTTCGGDKIGDVISQIFRIPQNGKPICVLEMSGLPSEVVSSVVSVVCRMAFDLALSSDGAVQTLVVCEEAHRYIPAKAEEGFWPTRAAIGRIAKEGRKYGVFLGIITQRPGELDPTILSQCNSFFAMRLSNTRDQEIIASAFNSGAASTISFLPSISNRECIAFGEALYTPMRMTFETVKTQNLPGANIRENQNAVRAGKQINLNAVITRMRGISQSSENHEVDELAESFPTQEIKPQAGSDTDPGGMSLRRKPGRAVPPKQRQPVAEVTKAPPLQPRTDRLPTANKPTVPEPASPTSIEQRYKEVQSSTEPLVSNGNAGNELFKAFRNK